MSNVKTKLVNIRATIPVRNVTPPIYGSHDGVIMTQNDILKCLCKRAVVHEVLPDGSTIRLNTKNFRDDHTGIAVKKVITHEEKKKIQIPITKDPEQPRELVSDDDGFDFSMIKEKSVMEERTYVDDSVHSVIAGSQVIFAGDDEDEEDASEPEEPDNQMEERVYVDGIARNVPVNSCLIHKDPQADCDQCNGEVHSTSDTCIETKVEKKPVVKAKSTKSNKKVSGKKK